MKGKISYEQQELPGLDVPVGWVELGQLFGAHEQLHHELEEAKDRVKELKSKYEASQNILIHAGKRVRRTLADEARRVQARGLANRRVDADGDDLDLLEDQP